MTRHIKSPPLTSDAALDAATAEFRTWLKAELAKGRKATWDIQVSLDPAAGSVKLWFRPPYKPLDDI